MASSRYLYIPNRVIDQNGISDGASLYFYEAGTTTLIDIFSDIDLTAPLANPVVVPAGAAVPQVYYEDGSAIRVYIVDEDGQEIDDQDPWDPSPLVSSTELPLELTAEYLLNYVATNGGVDLLAGRDYTIDTVFVPTVPNLFFDGHGSSITNVNPTPYATNGNITSVMAIGASHPVLTQQLTYYNIVSYDGGVLTMATGKGSFFNVGDMVQIRGATYYLASGLENYYLKFGSRVKSVVGDVVTLDDALPFEFAADSPEMANVTTSDIEAVADAYNLEHVYMPTIQNLRFYSIAESSGLLHGGVNKGTFRNLYSDGRVGLSCNAMTMCMFENITFRAWLRGIEFAEGSYGTSIKGVRGSMYESGNGSSTFVVAFGEGSHHCTLEDFYIDCGGANISGNSMFFAIGSHNVFRNGTFIAQHAQQSGLAFQNVTTSGNPCSYNRAENIKFFFGTPSYFLRLSDLGSGMQHNTVKSCQFYGTPAVSAVLLGANDTTIEDCHFDNGGFHFQTLAETGNIIRNNYIKNGFANLNLDVLANNTIYGNISDASQEAWDNAVFKVGYGATGTGTTMIANFTTTIPMFSYGDRIRGRIRGRTTGADGIPRLQQIRFLHGIGGSYFIAPNFTATGEAFEIEVDVYFKTFASAVAVAKWRSDSDSGQTVTDITGRNFLTEAIGLSYEVTNTETASTWVDSVEFFLDKAGYKSREFVF